MVGACGDITFPTRPDHVARAVLIGAEKRSTAMDPFLDAGFVGIERVGWTARVSGDSTSRLKLCVIFGAIPVAHPFPDVPGHVVQAVAVWRKLADLREAAERVR